MGLKKYSILLLLFFLACTKKETVVESNNDPTPPHRVSTLKVENYVNRLFIDLLGRTPTEEELLGETKTLFEENLSEEARRAIILKLQEDVVYREGDSTYQKAYYQRFYDLAKAKMIEGVADVEFNLPIGLAKNAVNRGRLVGDSIQVQRGLLEMQRNQFVLLSNWQYRNGSITVNEVFARMLNNAIYDLINMNTFNFVNASFDDLYDRFPTQNEFDAAFNIIQNNEVGSLFGNYATNKREYCILMTESFEFYEGMIYWAYQSHLGRDPSSSEVASLFDEFVTSRDYQELQRKLLVTDEYANF